MTLNMIKYNTVPTNRSDVTGKIVAVMVTWGTSAVFGELALVTGLELIRREIGINAIQLIDDVYMYQCMYTCINMHCRNESCFTSSGC